jgi:hypothetical protein
LQSRPIIELRYNNIKNVIEANTFLKDKFIPWFNNTYAVIPKNKADLHKKNNLDLDEVFSIKKERLVGNDFVVRYKNNYYQVKEEQPVTVLRKSRVIVIVETRINGERKIRQKGKYLNFFTLSSRPIKEIESKMPALAARKSDWKSLKNHPWGQYKNKVEV